MNEDNKDINEEFENSDNSLNNQSDDEITSQPSEAKSADDQIALKVFKYFKEFIFCVAFLILAWMSFWVIVVLSILSFIVRVVDSGQLSELNEFSRRLSLYLKECLLFSTGNNDQKPFPFEKFPD
ncbi:MAG: DUF4389 domain-containing protein [Pseudomonadota bacterium]|jgi:hypothetical protein|nr:DUF4389 domain-containing protein [Pseudomonadota bacterium]|tara:strand:- start:3 stop:377 length:375 start_codon:yes stop_codon:yes gene_type:complete